MSAPEYLSNWQIALDDSEQSKRIAMTVAHDNVIRSAGEDRLSGVSWTFWRTDDAPLLRTPDGDIEVDPATTELCRRFPGRVLVMATVEVKPL